MHFKNLNELLLSQKVQNDKFKRRFSNIGTHILRYLPFQPLYNPFSSLYSPMVSVDNDPNMTATRNLDHLQPQPKSDIKTRRDMYRRGSRTRDHEDSNQLTHILEEMKVKEREKEKEDKEKGKG